VGITSVCQTTIDNAVFSGFLIRMRPKPDVLNIGYSKYFFRSKHVRDYFTKEMNSVIRASLGQNLLKNLPVLLPSLIEQERIAALLDSKCETVESLIAATNSEITLLHEYRTCLISDVITGKLDVRDILITEYETVENVDFEDECSVDDESAAEDE
jgi:type I restriction enzyme S subunit